MPNTQPVWTVTVRGDDIGQQRTYVFSTEEGAKIQVAIEFGWEGEDDVNDFLASREAGGGPAWFFDGKTDVILDSMEVEERTQGEWVFGIDDGPEYATADVVYDQRGFGMSDAEWYDQPDGPDDSPGADD